MENCMETEKQHMHSAKYRPNKPVVERKRRERINNSLNQLKALVLEAFNKDETKYSKLEKADILEMTVLHLKTVQKRKLALASQNDPRVVENYQAGFRECAQEISHYLTQADQLSPDQKTRVVHHLNNSVHRVHSPVQQPYYPTPVMDVTPRQPLVDLPAIRQPLQVLIPAATSPSTLPGCRTGSPFGSMDSFPSVSNNVNGQYMFAAIPTANQVYHTSASEMTNQSVSSRGSPIGDVEAFHRDFSPVEMSSRGYSPILTNCGLDVLPAQPVASTPNEKAGGGKIHSTRDRKVWRPW